MDIFIWLVFAVAGLIVQWFLIRSAVLSALGAHADNERRMAEHRVSVAAAESSDPAPPQP